MKLPPLLESAPSDTLAVLLAAKEGRRDPYRQMMTVVLRNYGYVNVEGDEVYLTDLGRQLLFTLRLKS